MIAADQLVTVPACLLPKLWLAGFRSGAMSAIATMSDGEPNAGVYLQVATVLTEGLMGDPIAMAAVWENAARAVAVGADFNPINPDAIPNVFNAADYPTATE